jgi:antitoxin YefM
METFTAEEAAQNLLKLITFTQLDNTQFRITSEEGTVILLSEETYQNLMVTLELLSTPGLMNSLKCFKRAPDSVS